MIGQTCCTSKIRRLGKDLVQLVQSLESSFDTESTSKETKSSLINEQKVCALLRKIFECNEGGDRIRSTGGYTNQLHKVTVLRSFLDWLKALVKLQSAYNASEQRLEQIKQENYECVFDFSWDMLNCIYFRHWQSLSMTDIVSR